MRLLIVTQYFWPESFRVNDLAAGLVQRKHQVTVLTGMPNYPEGRLYPGYRALRPSRQSHGGAEVVRVPLIPRGRGQSLRLAMNYLSFAVSGSLLGPWRCPGPYDAVLVFQLSPVLMSLPAILIKALRRAPLALWVQDLWPESLSAVKELKPGLTMALLERMVRWIYSRCDHLFVQSRAFTPHLVERGVEAGRISYLPNWAEKEYRPMVLGPEAPERNEVPAGFRVMFAGNIGAAQSFETILAAAERLRDRRDIHWVVLGEGRRKQWVEEEVRRRGLSSQVHLLGRRPTEAMPRYFALADALLVTLARQPIFALTIPSKVQSYFACGRPVLAALDGEGARVIRESGAGLVCGCEDAEGLARLVLALHQMPRDERDAMARRGVEYFTRHFERETLLDEMERQMALLVERRTCAS